MTTMVINLILVVGLYSFVGLSGVFSFGHMAFTLVGAYTYAYLSIPVETKAIVMDDLPSFLAQAHMPTVAATITAGFVAAVLAVIVAIPLTRIAGLSAALGTFAVLIIVNQVARNWQDLTNGTSGVPAIPTTTTIQSATVWALFTVSAVFLLQRSRFGLRLRASREDDVAARAIAIRIPYLRGTALVLSAFICRGRRRFVSRPSRGIWPGTFFLELTFLILVMLVIGGIKSLAGAVVGAIVVSVVSELFLPSRAGRGLRPFSIRRSPRATRGKSGGRSFADTDSPPVGHHGKSRDFLAVWECCGARRPGMKPRRPKLATRSDLNCAGCLERPDQRFPNPRNTCSCSRSSSKSSRIPENSTLPDRRT